MFIKRKINFTYVMTTILFVAFLIAVVNNSKDSVGSVIIQPKPENTLSVLTANVGNLSFGCRDVLYKLCYKDVEERIANNIKLLKPDIVALQEVLAPWQCKKIQTNNTNKVCYDNLQPIPQARRLLGNEYTIACNNRNENQFECIAIRTNAGNIVGCKQGELCNIAKTNSEIDGCDNGFTVSAVTIILNSGYTFDVVNFHPQSTDAGCRAKMISSAFGENSNAKPLIQKNNVLLMGDFNFDPWRDHDESIEVWNNYFAKGWGGKQFTYHSGVAETNPPYMTTSLFCKKRSVDFIVSNFAGGVCNVLGESPNTQRLDGGSGTDHRAIFGFLNIDMVPEK